MNEALTIEDIVAIDDMISYLQQRGYSGQRIAAALRDEGFAIQDVKVQLEEWGYHASYEAFLDLRSLFVSNQPLDEGQTSPTLDRNHASSLLVIWLGPPRRQGNFQA